MYRIFFSILLSSIWLVLCFWFFFCFFFFCFFFLFLFFGHSYEFFSIVHNYYKCYLSFVLFSIQKLRARPSILFFISIHFSSHTSKIPSILPPPPISHYNYFTECEFFTPALTSGLSLEAEWQQVSSGFDLSWFLILPVFFVIFGDQSLLYSTAFFFGSLARSKYFSIF